MTRKEKILRFFEENATIPLMLTEVAGILGVPESDIDEFMFLAEELIAEGKLIKVGKKRFEAAKKSEVYEGVFIAKERGFGFVTAEGEDYDFYVAPENTLGAIDNDTVLVKELKRITGERKEAAIIKILKREDREFSGVFKGKDIFGYVRPTDKKLPDEIYITENSVGAKNGDRVACRINGKNIKNVECEITRVLGKDTDVGIDVLSCLINHGINDEFPKNVILASKRQPKEVTEEEIKKRVDLRGEIIVTIDGEDAKDLDDAVNVKRLDNGNFELGVHIADVGNYVKFDSVIDKEARQRGTSVYPVDRVVPMLPEALSNGICSLNPNANRLTLSVVMEIESTGKVVKSDIFESVIKTTKRMSYGDVTAILEGNEKIIAEHIDVAHIFALYQELAEVLRESREREGSIDFDFPESRAVLDEDGRCIDIVKTERGISNGIIEEFMLKANETVAKFLTENEIPGVFRVHERPSEEKIAFFSEFARGFGYYVPKNSSAVTPKVFQSILKQAKGKKEERLISNVMLRSMMKADYRAENEGHFGLAMDYYCHFTSPIRRYPDLVIHRIIKDVLNKKKINKEKLIEFTKEASQSSSKAEIRAQDAERETLAMKKAEFMQNHIGEKFSGIVSSVTSYGMFVELDNTIEGLVAMSDLTDDYYEFDENTMSLLGTRRGKVYSLGDTASVTIIKADSETGEINFALSGTEKVKKTKSDFGYKGKRKNKEQKQRYEKHKKSRQKVSYQTAKFLKKKSKRGKNKRK